jgi:DNA-binding response OmpR family regulator
MMDQAAAPAISARQRVLIADDDATTRLAIGAMLRREQFEVEEAVDGADAIRQINTKPFALVFLDIWMPGKTGLEVLTQIRDSICHPKVIVMTSDETPETLLRAVREQAYDYINKPFPPKEAVEIARRALETRAAPIEVISAIPEWVELHIPCTRESAERVQGVLTKMESTLPESLRDSIGQAFRELLLNAVEWGGKLDPNRKVRISCVRTPRMVMYRIADPGPGFNPKKLPHAAVGQPEDDPTAHILVRDKMGIRAGGFGIVMTRALADELIYNEARNEVIFIKYLE